MLAMDRDNNSVIDNGLLAVINNQIDQTTGTIQLKATFPNADLRLWPGEFVNARLLLTTRKNGIVIPAAAVQRGPKGSLAFVIRPNQTVEARPIKVAQIDHDVALIDNGLKVGEQVVVEGQYRLQEGSAVTATWQQPQGTGAPVDNVNEFPKVRAKEQPVNPASSTPSPSAQPSASPTPASSPSASLVPTVVPTPAALIATPAAAPSVIPKAAPTASPSHAVSPKSS